jgi:phage terminase large subunit
VQQTQPTVKIQIPQEYKVLFEDDWRNLLIHGGRYSLKSHTVARALLIRGKVAKKRTLCAREFQNSINDSSYQLLVDLIALYEMTDYRVTKDSIINMLTGSDFLFRGLRHNEQSVKSIEGIDTAWVEEAQTISTNSIDILTPTVRKPGSQLIWTFNRLLELDPVYEKFALNPRPDTRILNINYDIAERYGWLPKEIKAEIEFDRINNPELYAHKWLGQPMSQAEKAIIGRDNALQAMQRDMDLEGVIEVGVDVARMGNDRTVFKKRKGMAVIDTLILSHQRTTEVCDLLEAFVDMDKTVPLKIDDTGVGGGVTDEMMKRGYKVIAVNFGAKANDPDKYPNLISEAWFYLASIIDQVAMPMNSDLLMELTTRQWVMDSKGRRGVESKDVYKKRGYRSPDEADAVILCFYTPKVHIIDWANDPTDVI